MNQQLTTLCLGGGLLAILVFIHFVIDWVFQTHKEAMNKHNNAAVRARHCLIYTLGFVPVLFFLHHAGSLSNLETFLSVNILFWSHFYLDTYHGVYLWACHIRRPSEMFDIISNVDVFGHSHSRQPDLKDGFVKFINTTLGKILMIAIDQILHICFLIPIIWMVFN